MRKALLAAAVGAAATVVGLTIPATAATGGDSTDAAYRHCAAQFDAAQRADMESFRDFDAATFRAGHDPDAVSIFAQGQRFVGIDAIMAALKNHFTNKNAVWTWTELNRRVIGCKTAFIEYDANYDIPSIGFHQRALTDVTYVYESGQWKSILDQGTLLELTTG
ncbi:MAG TPA: DUF4440 domain-containing protein [Jatrophihabitans sp.]|jgi:hypothetical protein|nr:DUF4440 domain-containing protein [Jatrophihabitans sp.]